MSGDVRQPGVSARVDLADSLADAADPAADAAALQHLLRQVPLFARMGKRDLRHLAARSQVVRCHAGEAIVRANFSAEAFFVILSGSVCVERSDGRRRTIAAGGCFGELGLIDGAGRDATVIATDDVIVLKIKRQAFLELLDAEPTVCRALVDTLVERIREIEHAD